MTNSSELASPLNVPNMQCQNFFNEAVKYKVTIQHTPCRICSKYPVRNRRMKVCQELLAKVKTSQQRLLAWAHQGNWNSASFAGSLAIVRSGRPYADVEYARKFILDVSNELFDNFRDKY